MLNLCRFRGEALQVRYLLQGIQSILKFVSIEWKHFLLNSTSPSPQNYSPKKACQLQTIQLHCKRLRQEFSEESRPETSSGQCTHQRAELHHVIRHEGF